MPSLRFEFIVLDVCSVQKIGISIPDVKVWLFVFKSCVYMVFISAFKHNCAASIEHQYTGTWLVIHLNCKDDSWM